jgi:hypothetical protein
MFDAEPFGAGSQRWGSLVSIVARSTCSPVPSLAMSP